MSRHLRRNHSAEFKVKVALAAVRGKKTRRNSRASLRYTRSPASAGIRSLQP